MGSLRPRQLLIGNLERLRGQNSTIERAKAFKDSYNNKVRGIEADRDIATSAEEKLIASERG